VRADGAGADGSYHVSDAQSDAAQRDGEGPPDVAGRDADGPDAPRPDGGAADTAPDDVSRPDVPRPDGSGPDVGGSDGGRPDVGGPDAGGDTGGPVEPGTVRCRDLPAPTQGTCAVTPGSAALLIRGVVLAPEAVYEGGEVLVAADGRIACVGCDCSGAAGAAGATVVSCRDGVVSPGLINSHDHLTFTQNAPGDWGTERYDHRHDWRKGKHGHTKIPVPGNASTNQQVWGELRHVLGGATAVAGSGGAAGFLRNLDRSTAQREGMGAVDIDYETFPLGDSDGEQLAAGCGYPSLPSRTALRADCWFPHVAEGVNAFARNEFLCLSSSQNGGVDMMEPGVAIVHGVGMLAVDGRELALNGTAVVWSPRSNVSLYGNTAPVTMFAAQGVLIGLGTDWTASGSINMQRELACAAYLNDVHYGGYFSDRDLWLMATANNALALSVDDRIGTLSPGLWADIAIFRDRGSETRYGAVIESDVSDTLLVLRGGDPLFGDDAVVAGVPGGASGCELIPGGVCGVAKRACVQREIGSTYAQLAAANGSAYRLFACGAPADEPSCEPFRAGEYDGVRADDLDGDGIPNAADLCPTVFDPIRPLDGLDTAGAAQRDHDRDGLGDVCDPCPTDPGADACAPPNPNDSDGDGRDNPVDNCPRDFNPQQEDRDFDGIGDACDLCPDAPNPGGAPCPATIYEVKTGAIDVGTAVTLSGVVTAVAAPRFFVQVPAAEQDPRLGAAWSGIYVYVPAGNPLGITVPRQGDRVRLSGRVQDFYGQLQLTNPPAVQILASGSALPAPVPTTPAAAGTGGPDADELEAVLVTVSGTVTALNPPAGPGDASPTNEYVLDGALRVNDFVWATTPAPALGDELQVTGVLRWANEDSKVEPRGPADVTWLAASPPRLAGFGPGPVYIAEGAVDTVSTPPLEILLDRPAPAGGLSVNLSSASAAVGVPRGVTVPQGQRSVAVPLSGLSATPTPAIVRASLETVTLAAQVVVVAAGRVPAPVAIEPEELVVRRGEAAVLTVRMDVPAPAGGVVVTLAADEPTVLSLPAQVTVPVGATSATFPVTGQGLGVAVVSASTPTGSAVSLVEVTDAPTIGLVLSEVLYDTEGEDSGFEWVELYNGSGVELDLSSYAIGAGGDDYTYSRFALSGRMPPGACWVVGGPQSSSVNGSPAFDLARDFDPDLQNSGSTADGVALFALPAAAITGASVPIDAVIYGTTNANALLDETGRPGAVDVGDADRGRSIERFGATWRIQAAPTPNDCSAALAP
jgi:hypothetical protein